MSSSENRLFRAEIFRIVENFAKVAGIHPKEVDFKDFKAELSGHKSESEILAYIDRVKGFNGLKNWRWGGQVTENSIEAKEVSVGAQVERKVFDQKAYEHLTLTDFLDRLTEKLVKNLPNFEPTVKNPIPPPTVDLSFLNLMLSDTHFGAFSHKSDEFLDKFDGTTEAKSLSSIIQQTLEIGSKTNFNYRGLNLLLGGDIIQNLMHENYYSASISEQCAAAISLLAQAIEILSHWFYNVNAYCVTGNHGRVLSKNKDRATDQKWDSYENIIYHSLKTCLRWRTNVNFTIPRSGFCVVPMGAHNLFLCHGDSIVGKGSAPGKNVRFDSFESLLNKINLSPKLAKQNIKSLAIGHFHVGSYSELSNGCAVITNGALLPTDAYGIHLGHFNSSPGQVLWESTPNEPVTNFRFLKILATEPTVTIKPFEYSV